MLIDDVSLNTLHFEADSASECEAKCKQNASCLSYELFKTKRCQLSNKKEGDPGVGFGPHGAFYYCERGKKHGADPEFLDRARKQY